MVQSLDVADKLIGTDEPRARKEFADTQHLRLKSRIAVDYALHGSLVVLQ